MAAAYGDAKQVVSKFVMRNVFADVVFL